MALSKRATRREEMESWGDRQADMRLHVEVRERNRSSSKRHRRSVERYRRGVQNSRPPKWEIPSRAVPCSPRYRAWVLSHLCVSRMLFFCCFFFPRWYIWIIPHMHTFTVQGCPVCHQRLKSSEVVTCRDLGGRIDRKVAMHEKPLLQSVVSHCRFLLQREVFDGLSKTRKSHLQIITIKKKLKPRWQALSYVQAKPPSRDENSWIMAQLLVCFATSKCSPHVIKWFNRHFNLCMLPYWMYINARSEHGGKKNSSWALRLPQLTRKPKKKKAIKYNDLLFISPENEGCGNLSQKPEDMTTLVRFSRQSGQCIDTLAWRQQIQHFA